MKTQKFPKIGVVLEYNGKDFAKKQDFEAEFKPYKKMLDPSMPRGWQMGRINQKHVKQIHSGYRIQLFQPEDQIVTVEDDTCAGCGEPLEPIYENNGFDEPGAEHQEFVGYKLCNHGE